MARAMFSCDDFPLRTVGGECFRGIASRDDKPFLAENFLSEVRGKRSHEKFLSDLQRIEAIEWISREGGHFYPYRWPVAFVRLLLVPDRQNAEALIISVTGDARTPGGKREILDNGGAGFILYCYKLTKQSRLLEAFVIDEFHRDGAGAEEFVSELCDVHLEFPIEILRILAKLDAAERKRARSELFSPNVLANYCFTRKSLREIAEKYRAISRNAKSPLRNIAREVIPLLDEAIKQCHF